VTNQGSLPVSRIEIPVYHVSNFVVPKGWSSSGSDKNRLFVAEAMTPSADIRKGQHANFSCAILYQDSWPGKAMARIAFRDGGFAEIANVPVPSREPRSSVWLTPLLLLALAMLVVWAGRRRAAKAAQQGP
jgi:hypothetical protein